MRARAATEDDIPALVSVVSDPDLAIATWVVHLHLAIEMQDSSEIQRNIGAAHRSSDHGSDVGDGEHDGVVQQK